MGRKLLWWCLPPVLLMTMLLCVCAGSVPLSPGETLQILWRGLTGTEAGGSGEAIILRVRLPRVLCVALTGASLSLCGAAMQGLLRNPLADGSTLGVSSGASLGAVLAIVLGMQFPGLPFAGTMVMAMLFAFGSLALILTLAYALDRSLATGTIILIGVVFSMFVSSLMNLLITFAGEKIKSITFWTLGSLSGSTYVNALTLLLALTVCGGVLLALGGALNAFALGEEQAQHLGVSVRRVKLTVMAAVSVLLGVCVSIGGTIGFVGLVIPHMVRLVLGPDHRRLLPASLLAGAVFLLLADLVGRTLLSPIELPIGVVTSLVGAVAFLVIFYRSRKRGNA
ncbi:MAG TPA: iron ABC transporter permease [Candidatus Egerieenecus merdigallinarum]|nr:iron ABC transporter permease [Candidatus Egerieenecus merdigallinarum]